jgi:2-succinyl-5-enolpyruvyl-6-hydroxy-3-cyclohexene-1-carboxylate synthase
MISSAKLEVQLLVDACKRVGVTRVVLSPGSRNAPLSIAFDEDDHFEIFVVPDERCAAFYALGMAMQSRHPVVLACTSGSAPLNYYPAVVEAFYQRIPLIVLTADRPEEWVDQGDGQTIRQRNVFGDHVVKAGQLFEIHSDTQRWNLERILAETLQASIGKSKGPVHINVPLSEPLYQTTSEITTLKSWIHAAHLDRHLSENEERRLRVLWNNSHKRLVIVGQHEPDRKLQDALNELVKDNSVAILVEHTSNVQHPYFVSCIDRVLGAISDEQLASFNPELIVTIGGAIVSKRIKRFLRASKAPVVRFGTDFPWMDTFQHLVYSAEINAATGIRLLSDWDKEKPVFSGYGANWNKLSFEVGQRHEAILPQMPFCDLKVMQAIMDVVPDETHFHVSNSSMIRYALLFDPIKGLTYHCNRGTSGIDGSTSTACGAALVDSKKGHLLVTGDLSFFYDSNAFWSAQLPKNLRVIIVNNGGGDIFSIIPGPSTTAQHKKIFVAEQAFKAKGICETFDVEYLSAGSMNELDQIWASFFDESKNDRPKLLEIMTSGCQNSQHLAAYFNKIKEA